MAPPFVAISIAGWRPIGTIARRECDGHAGWRGSSKPTAEFGRDSLGPSFGSLRRCESAGGVSTGRRECHRGTGSVQAGLVGRAALVGPAALASRCQRRRTQAHAWGLED